MARYSRATMAFWPRTTRSMTCQLPQLSKIDLNKSQFCYANISLTRLAGTTQYHLRSRIQDEDEVHVTVV